MLSYVPVRKSATIDIIEERTQARDVALTLNIPRNFTHARLVPENVELNVVRTETGAQIKLPCIDGYAIVELS